MKDRVIKKLKQLEKQYDMWLRAYDEDGLEYQENKLLVLRYQIDLLKELLEGCDYIDSD